MLRNLCACCEPVKARHSKVFVNEIDFFDTFAQSLTEPALQCTFASAVFPFDTLNFAMSDGRRSVHYDPEEAIAALTDADPKLGELIRRAGPFTMRLKSQHSPFEALVESIIYQQIHGKAAFAILSRLLHAFGDIHPQPDHILAAPEEMLRACGLSANKLKALRDLAAKTLDGTVPTLSHIRRMRDEEIVGRLTQVRGVGQWTVEMLLIFRLGRPDIFPVSDYGVRKGFLLTFGRPPKSKPITPAVLPKPDIMLRRAKKWQPWRSVASWYLWRACDLHGSASPPPE
jgi:DNA-3-methyladenine glycosylase II